MGDHPLCPMNQCEIRDDDELSMWLHIRYHVAFLVLDPLNTTILPGISLGIFFLVIMWILRIPSLFSPSKGLCRLQISRWYF